MAKNSSDYGEDKGGSVFAFFLLVVISCARALLLAHCVAVLGACAAANDDPNFDGRWSGTGSAVASQSQPIDERVEENHEEVAIEIDDPPPSSMDELTFPEPDPALIEVEPGSLPTWSDEEIQVQRTHVAAELNEFNGYPYRYSSDAKTRIHELMAQDEVLRAELEARGLEDFRPLWSEAHMSELMKKKLNEGKLIRPVDGGITSPYGNRFHPIAKEYRLHTGTDFGEPTGEPVAASGSGRVYFAGVSGGYGNLVQVDHGNGLTTRYAHLSRIRVKVGDLVAQGHRVGDVGSTGNSTGPHLHFEVRIDGASIDPMGAIGTR